VSWGARTTSGLVAPDVRHCGASGPATGDESMVLRAGVT
jgi:hypothetical protein